MTRLACRSSIFLIALFTACNDPWQSGIDTAERTARRKNQPFLVYFPPSDAQLEIEIRQRILTDPLTAAAIEPLEKARIDSSRLSKEHGRFAMHQTQTCMLVCRPDGSRALVPFFLNPVPSADAFRLWLGKALQRAHADHMPARITH